jgi:hypothetical protein
MIAESAVFGAVLAGVDVLRRWCCRSSRPDDRRLGRSRRWTGRELQLLFVSGNKTHSVDAVFTMLLGAHFIDSGNHK